jgi:hypothetical protein
MAWHKSVSQWASTTLAAEEDGCCYIQPASGGGYTASSEFSTGPVAAINPLELDSLSNMHGRFLDCVEIRT